MDPNTISDGDPIWVRTSGGELHTGNARFDQVGDLVLVEKSGAIALVIAEFDAEYGYEMVDGFKIIGHIPQLEFE